MPFMVWVVEQPAVRTIKKIARIPSLASISIYSNAWISSRTPLIIVAIEDTLLIL